MMGEILVTFLLLQEFVLPLRRSSTFFKYGLRINSLTSLKLKHLEFLDADANEDTFVIYHYKLKIAIFSHSIMESKDKIDCKYCHSKVSKKNIPHLTVSQENESTNLKMISQLLFENLQLRAEIEELKRKLNDKSHDPFCATQLKKEFGATCKKYEIKLYLDYKAKRVRFNYKKKDNTYRRVDFKFIFNAEIIKDRLDDLVSTIKEFLYDVNWKNLDKQTYYVKFKSENFYI